VPRVYILDGYLDEPSCLGVPPYIAPHVRYTYGALKAAGIRAEDIGYGTIDQYRKQPQLLDLLQEAELVVIIAGATVPGKYLGGMPISLQEIRELATALRRPKTILSGPIIHCSLDVGPVDYLAKEVPGLVAYQLLTGEDPEKSYSPPQLVDWWAPLGAEVTIKHLRYPHLVCEIETFRGCPRSSHCSFCSERFKKVVYHRSVSGIIAEVRALAQLGNLYFRLGAQTDLLLFQAVREGHALIPNPKAIEELYAGIREAAPNLKVLHMDNINPATIADHPNESARALAIIAKYNTPGDTAAFGLESADPAVLRANNIGTDVEKTFRAIEIMNEVGGWREQGIPKLLPGLNFLHGLEGEGKQTMDLNLEFLLRVRDAGLMVRRINIRQVNPLGSYRKGKLNPYLFQRYKEAINKEINKPMLQKVFPLGTLLQDVVVEESQGLTAYGRQLGTYPILVGIPGKFPVGSSLDVKIVDHGYRSITGLPWPLDINRASLEQLEALPGIGKSRARKIFLAGELKSMADLQALLPDADLSNLETLGTGLFLSRDCPAG
jgi:radical SAM superfamily enzyme with C-terminal helix-hairpin-helix motif